jgi:hypothetical protein
MAAAWDATCSQSHALATCWATISCAKKTWEPPAGPPPMRSQYRTRVSLPPCTGIIIYAAPQLELGCPHGAFLPLVFVRTRTKPLSLQPHVLSSADGVLSRQYCLRHAFLLQNARFQFTLDSGRGQTVCAVWLHVCMGSCAVFGLKLCHRDSCLACSRRKFAGAPLEEIRNHLG